MQRFTLQYRAYVLVVFAAGMLLLTLATRDFVLRNTPVPALGDAALWFAMLCVAIISPIPLLRRGGHASLSPGFEFAAILVFGPAVACWLTVLARILVNINGRWDSKTTLSIGESALAVGAAGMVYTQLHGRVGAAFTPQTASGVALLAAAFVLIIMRHAVPYAAQRVHIPELTVNRKTDYRQAFVMECVLLPLAVPLSLAQIHLGAIVAGLFAAPLILARYVQSVWDRSKKAHFAVTRTLMSALDASDPFTRGHSYRISKLCLRVGRALELSKRELEELEYAALMHDLGRISSQSAVFSKPGALDQDERTLVRAHPRLAAAMLAQIGFLPEAARIVLAHHEQPDGLGYPAGLRGNDIPIASRIIMVVAAFDAMTYDRPYRRGMQPAAAIEELLSRAGSQFCSDVVATFIDLYAHDALFEDFDADILQQYAGEGSNSRAVEEYLVKHQLLRTAPAVAADPGEIDVTLDETDLHTEDLVELQHRLTAAGDTKLVAAGLTNVGCVRANNEDALDLFASENPSRGCLLTVADGMGGAAAGEVASRLSVETVRDSFFGDAAQTDAGTSLRNAIARANEAVLSHATADDQYFGMGSTCVAAAIVGLELTVAHVGDSRAYRIKRGSIERLTQDHNLSEELMCVAGMEGLQGAKNLLTRSLGQRNGLEPSVSESIRLAVGESIVLCSDGLSNVVEDEEILATVANHCPSVACTKLVELACQRGGPDNITVVVARIEDE